MKLQLAHVLLLGSIVGCNCFCPGSVVRGFALQSGTRLSSQTSDVTPISNTYKSIAKSLEGDSINNGREVNLFFLDSISEVSEQIILDDESKEVVAVPNTEASDSKKDEAVAESSVKGAAIGGALLAVCAAGLNIPLVSAVGLGAALASRSEGSVGYAARVTGEAVWKICEASTETTKKVVSNINESMQKELEAQKEQKAKIAEFLRLVESARLWEETKPAMESRLAEELRITEEKRKCLQVKMQQEANLLRVEEDCKKMFVEKKEPASWWDTPSGEGESQIAIFTKKKRLMTQALVSVNEEISKAEALLVEQLAVDETTKSDEIMEPAKLSINDNVSDQELEEAKLAEELRFAEEERLSEELRSCQQTKKELETDLEAVDVRLAEIKARFSAVVN